MKIQRNYSGMTLVEVIIVMLVVSSLVILGIVYLRGQVFKGTDARRKGDIKKIQLAVEEYEKDHDCYPLPQTVSCDPGTGLSPYLGKVPCDPETKASYFYEHEDSPCPSWYRFYTKLTNTADPQISQLGCTSGCGPGLSYDYYASSPNAPAPIGTESGAGEESSGGGGASTTEFYGCKSGACVPLVWDVARPGPECDPNYQSSTCYSQCGSPNTECMSWH